MPRSTKLEPKQLPMSEPGAAERAAEIDSGPAVIPVAPAVAPARVEPQARATPEHDARSAALDDFFIPDLCANRRVFTVVLTAELIAVTLSLARTERVFPNGARANLAVPPVARAHERRAALLCAAVARANLGVAGVARRVRAVDAQHGARLGSRALFRRQFRRGSACRRPCSRASTGRSCSATKASA